MIRLMNVGEGGSFNPERVLVVASLKSAPIKRLLAAMDSSQVVNLTYGYPQRSLVLLDTGLAVVTRYDANELALAIRTGQGVHRYDEDVPF